MSQEAYELPFFRIGGQERDFLLVEVFGRSHSNADDYSDRNWLSTKVSVQVSAFAGHYRADLRSDELTRFLSSLQLAYASLETEILFNEAKFEAIEEQLSIVIQRDNLGHFTAKCVAMDDASIGNRLEFKIDFDQSDVPAILNGLETILAKFPVVGDPTH